MSDSNLPVFILCGGHGTRLREETEFRPKPMIMIGNRPVLWHIMKIYDYFGFRNFVLCLGYKAEVIKDYFLNYRAHVGSSSINLRAGEVESVGGDKEIEDWHVSLIDTGIHTMTGLRVQRALKVIPAQRFLLTYGDGVANVDVQSLLEHHKKAGGLATITAVRPSSRFGELGLQGDTVRSFLEKPQTDAGWINGGFMVFEREAFDLLETEQNEPLETAVLEKLSEQGQLSVYRHDSFWQCMDTYREMQLLEGLWRSGNAAWHLWAD